MADDLDPGPEDRWESGDTWESGAVVRLRRPDGFYRVRDADLEDGTDADLVLAREPTKQGGFRMNLVVTVGPAPDTLEAAASAALAGAMALSPSVHVIGCHMIDEHTFGYGRRIEFGYPTPGGAVFVSQWVFLADARQVVATASRSIDHVLAMDSTFTAMVQTLQLVDGLS